MAFVPDGRVLASSDHKNIYLWDPTEGRVTKKLSVYYAYVQCLSLSLDGQLLASGSSDGTVRVWNLTTDQESIVLKGNGKRMFTVSFSPDGRLLTSSYSDGKIRLWDLSEGALQKETSIGFDNILLCALFLGENLIAVSTFHSQLQVRHIITGEVKWIQEQYGAWTLSITSDGRWLSTGSEDKNTKIWDSKNGELRQTLNDHFHVVWDKDDVMLSVYRGQWLCINGGKKLWIPGEYRPTCLAVANGIIAIGHEAGVFFIALKDIEKLLSRYLRPRRL
ncbi:WD40-repeat-containing domain protein [Aspergillus keveii]|uniref:WD40-repeat-containing domain protein n=1 Tax=Aspergillus keveii TaxID=714993 RepID=A0ABR4FHJ4_9EURO